MSEPAPDADTFYLGVLAALELENTARWSDAK